MSSLLYALDGFKARPTIDIDLLGERISNDGVHRTVTVRRDSVTSVTRFSPVFTCQQNKGKHPLRMLASYLFNGLYKLLFNSCLRRCQTCDRHAEWRAAGVVHANLGAELN